MSESGKLLSTAAMTAALLAAAWQAAAGAEESSKKPATYTVKRGPMKITAELEGVVVSQTTHEVSLDPKSWSEFTVTEAVPHGRQVAKGDVLVRFDPRKLEEAVADLEAEEQLADLAIEQAEKELPQLERSLKLDLQAAERARRVVKEDSERFANVERPVDEESAEWMMKDAQFWYENSLEELRQLEKMYKADELTEETEEIILKRQRYWVEQAKFGLKTAELARDRLKRLSIPRQQEMDQYACETSELALAKAANALALGLAEKRYALAKAKHGRSRAKEKLARLIQDKDLLVLRAPATGTVYYGRCMEGKWSDSESLMRRLSPGGGASPREVLMTIVNMEDVYVRVEVPEKHFPDLRVGMEAPVSVPAAGTEDLNGRLADVSRVPVATGKFAAKVALRARQGERPPVPGVTCKVKPVVYASQDALLVPTSAVGKDEGTGDRYVMLVEKDQPPKKRVVKVGRETEDTVEIREGLSAGDNIVKSVKEGQSA